MHDPVTYKLGIAQSRDHGKDTPLFAPLEVGLEADHVVQGAVAVILTQLDNSPVLFSRTRIAQTDRFERAVAQRIGAAAGHHLDRHAALKDPGIIKAVDLGLFGRDKGRHKGFVLLAGHGAVYIICRPLVITGGQIGAFHVDALQRQQPRRRNAGRHRGRAP